MAAVVLALDLATVTGFAATRPDGRPHSGRVTLPRGERQGQRLHAFRRWLTEKKAQLGGTVDFVVWEHAFRQPGAANELFHNLAGVLMDWCEHHEIGYMPVNPSTIKMHATGKGNAGKGAMVEAAKRAGFDVIDDNEADAVHLLRFVLATNPHLTAGTTP